MRLSWTVGFRANYGLGCRYEISNIYIHSRINAPNSRLWS